MTQQLSPSRRARSRPAGPGRDGARLAPALALFALGFGSNQYAPLIVLYPTISEITHVQTQGLFVLYVAGLVPALLLGGRLSDRLGRAGVVAAALALASASSIILMLSGTQFLGLLAGRVTLGVACGIGFSAGTAWVTETTAAGRGSRRAVVAMTLGFGSGPFAIGLLATGLVALGSAAPQVWAALPHAVIAAVAFVLVCRELPARRGPVAPPARVGPGPGGAEAAGLRDPRFRWIVVPMAPWVFLSAGLALAVLPAAVRAETGVDPLLASALITPLPAIGGLLVQPLVARLRGRRTRLTVVAMALVVAATSIGAVAVAQQSLLGLALAGIALGLGYGACQTTGLREVAALSSPERLGRNTAIFQVICYLGFLGPLPIALLAQRVPLEWVFAGLAGLAALTLAWVLRAGIVLSRRA